MYIGLMEQRIFYPLLYCHLLDIWHNVSALLYSHHSAACAGILPSKLQR